ncbi:MAG: tetratricopeptide repeat protein [Oceanicoccus sp.]
MLYSLRTAPFLLLLMSSFVLATAVDDPDYVGSKTCATCHQQQFSDWQGSHHDQAMMHVSKEAVLGDFNGSRFEYNGITTTFFKRGEEFWVNTDDENGKLQDFKIDYTFGITPLQQYLIGFDDGRFQALGIAWDSRSKEEGGQRWFHLYPQEQVDHKDVLHWTRYSNNWNSRCAECHSTNLKRNYQQATDSYQTTWSEVNVACESCHGPGVDHLNWAKTADLEIESKGLIRDVGSAADWQRLPGMATATMSSNHSALSDRQINNCGSCHSRRGTIHDPSSGQLFTEELLDTHMVSFIESPLYHSDGQIQDEVYVYGSFIQSKMHQRGVVCSNCHNPHSLKLKADGNQLCAQCHNPTQFDTEKHHHHPAESDGAQCINCHMPETTYMVVDPRRDHSLRVPRPDLSKRLGVPNACNQCHDDKSVEWSLELFKQWYPGRSEQPHYGALFYAGQQGSAQALPQLAALANDAAQTVMVRASALQMLGQYQHQYGINTAVALLDSPDPLIRLAALRVLDGMSLQQRMTTLWPVLDDPVRAVRIEATRLLAGVGLRGSMRAALSPDRQQQLDRAVEEYIEAASANADAPSGQLQLGVLYLAQGQTAKAKAAYEHALVLEPDFIPAMLNLADWYRAQGQDQQALPELQRALQVLPDNIDANYAIGLLYIRLKNLDLANQYLQKSASLAPGISHYSYVYAVSLFENGKEDWAITTLKQTLNRHPGNPDVLSALASYLNAIGRTDQAKKYADQLPQRQQ